MMIRFSMKIALCLFFGLAGVAPGQTSKPVVRSIREWVKGDGRTDDSAGVAAAFAACQKHSFMLDVDCPVLIHVGMDITRPIFVEDGTTVHFSNRGLFITDNVMIPTFVLANVSEILFENWKIKYAGQMPVDWETGGYFKNGTFIPRPGHAAPGAAFHDLRLTPWLTENRGVVFDQSKGHCTAPWSGPTNTSAIFYFKGSTNHVEFRHFRFFVPPDISGSRFIPICFSLNYGNLSHTTAAMDSPLGAPFGGVPNHMIFEDIDFDGYYFGWIGNVYDVDFKHIRAHRYGDLQDDRGNNVGGIGKWFAPPHLFYITYDPKHADIANRNVHISDVIDYGQRIGTARDRAGDKPLSGYANSLKFGGIDCSVDHYTSYRPDGLMDVLPCDNVTISHVEATYDSSFVNGIFPGIRFPSFPYRHLTIEDLNLVDLAAHPALPPIGGCNSPSNSDIRFINVRVTLNDWTSTKSLQPVFGGAGHQIGITFHVLKR